jgi:hypothetical protein
VAIALSITTSAVPNEIAAMATRRRGWGNPSDIDSTFVAGAEPSAGRAGSYANEISFLGVMVMGKGILLWLIGIPLPIIILLLIFWH